MLQLQIIRERTQEVIAKLQKKHFASAEAVINEVLVTDQIRRKTQQELDANLAQS